MEKANPILYPFSAKGSPGRGKQNNRTDGTMQSSRLFCNVHPAPRDPGHMLAPFHKAFAPDKQAQLFHPPS